MLTANGDYFHAMFTDRMKESNQELIELKDESISPDAFKIVMDSIYTRDPRVNEENVFLPQLIIFKWQLLLSNVEQFLEEGIYSAPT